ncbi:Gfo/Idh/MocA family protein [Algoriphagus aquimarinus]|uniref:Predicted dehydrogenase n=1 Tax=Algoriphagus aquimarinus TaxID=237018 RepID=A0A1I1AG62_9BACT|nr:Gfo/Idh/MocA family oxidoreductase [Algoriphagus aquimarinus]SFB36356.1 Predicted dehydrogenase [Algoriphagus aquimarinus]|tara:strand:- start:27190 stop:28539 length:1350 start_codon:yes stop_codon:yes gene_type:complete
MKKNNRRDFIKKSAAATVGFSALGSAAFSAKSYGSIIGANERLNVAIAGLGRRLGAYYEPIGLKSSNVNLMYLCDAMESQMPKAAKNFAKHIDYAPKLEQNVMKVMDDKEVDCMIIATPDHWHAPGTWLSLERGKNVYVEKPCSHNPHEGELLIALQKKYNKVVQMGNQQRSAPESREIISAIHNGAIGKAFMAKAFYSNNRGAVPNPVAAPAPTGLDWEMWQGPAPRKAYTHDTWDYNWHWYGWEYGTAETGNNATHELDVARWALQVDYPSEVQVTADKRHFAEDGWTMYDTMDATFKFGNGSVIQWDGKSRNSYKTYGSDRGTIIYGTEGSVYVDRGGYKQFDRSGKEVKNSMSSSNEAGTALGGGGDMSTTHIVNFFNAVRGLEKQNSNIEEGAVSTLLCHLANISYRTGETLKCDPKNGHIQGSKAASALWTRSYEKGWEPPKV